MLTEEAMIWSHDHIKNFQVKIALHDRTLKRLLECRTVGARYHRISKLSGKKTED